MSRPTASFAVPDFSALVKATPRPARPARPTLVAIDGVDGSGKTTFAHRLACEYVDQGRPALVVHLDDFLNPRSVRYRLGRASPEGFFRDTYDLRAFAVNVIDPLRPGGRGAIVPRAFDVRTDTPRNDDPIVVSPASVLIVEGMFLHRDELVPLWDMSVFLSVPLSVSVARLAQRDGTNPDPEHLSQARYVGGQRIYLDLCRPDERATHVVDNA